MLELGSAVRASVSSGIETLMMMRKMMKLRTHQKKSIMHCVSHTELIRQTYARKGEIQTISLHTKFEL